MNAFFPIVLTEDGKIISINDEHTSKAQSSIKVIEDGFSKVIFFNEVQLWKVPFPIVFIEDGIVITSKDEHSLKTLPSNEITEEGIEICLSDSQLENAWNPICVINGGIETSINDWHSEKAELLIDFKLSY